MKKRLIAHTGIHVTGDFGNALIGHGRAAYDSLPTLIRAINAIADKQAEIIEVVNDLMMENRRADDGTD